MRISELSIGDSFELKEPIRTRLTTYNKGDKFKLVEVVGEEGDEIFHVEGEQGQPLTLALDREIIKL